MVNNVKIKIKSLNVWFGKKHVIKDVNMKIKPNAVTAVMGPSGCGKTTLIRAINRLNELIKGSKTTGQIFIDKEDVYNKEIDVSSRFNRSLQSDIFLSRAPLFHRGLRSPRSSSR